MSSCEARVKIKRSHIITAIIVLVLLIGWVRIFWFGEVFHTQKRNEPNRAALLRIRDAIPIGASHADVLTVYWQYRTDRLRIWAEGPKGWSISTPLEFGARNWYLRIDFEDGRVAALRVRTEDGPSPKNGPPDKERSRS